MKYLEPDEPHWYICCHGCGMETDVFPSIEQAIAAWNRRAGQSHAAGLLAALEKMTFAYEHRSTLPPEYKVAAFNEARAAIAAAKGADQ
jgi:hypothetical protein